MSIWSTWVVAYLATAALFLAVDLVWLGVVARTTYRRGIGHLMRPRPLWGVALGFYALYVAGIVFFAVMPGLAAGSVWPALGYGALLGLIAYATYDMTNLATLEGWPAWLALLDTAWGTVLTALCAAGGWWVTRLVLA